MLQQHLGNSRVTQLACFMQRRKHLVAGSANVSAVLHQHARNALEAPSTRNVQRRALIKAANICVRVPTQQQPDHLLACRHAGHVQSSGFVGLQGVNVGTVVQQQFSGTKVPILACRLKWSATWQSSGPKAFI